MNKYDCVIFDLDGTLMDTSEGIIASVKYTVDKCGFPQFPEDKIRDFIGPPIQKTFQRVYGLSDEIAMKMGNKFRDRYKEHDLLKASLYPGIIYAIKRLRENGIKTAVATYKREDYALKLLDHYGMLELFDVVHGSDMEGRLSKSDIVGKCIRETGITDNDRVVLVGDTIGDADGARKAGIRFIAAGYGFGYKTKEEAEKADAYLNKATEIVDACINKAE